MFEELLIPLKDISSKQFNFSGPTWIQENHYFFIKRLKDKAQWFWQLGHHNCWEELVFTNHYNAGQINSNQKQKLFSSLKEAHQDAKNFVYPFLAEDVHKKLDNLNVDSDVCHEIIVPQYTQCQKRSGVYILGSPWFWRLYFDASKPTYTKIDHCDKVFSVYHKTRPQAIKSLYNSVSQHLPQIYATSKDYTKTKYGLQQQSDSEHDIFVDADSWWIMFTRPDIDLSKIF